MNVPTHRQHLFPFVLSLSKYERTLRAINDFSNPDSFFKWFFNPSPLTAPISVRAELVEVGTDAPPFQSLPFDKLRANGLERCSSTGSGRSRANGLERCSSTSPGRSRVNRSERWRPSSPGHMPLFESKTP
ncbi:MAG: hypothetical protein LBD67_07470 [Candidatus Accumulibacter sp.]|nr:hypothetical protein [Accumulibacter sp.]